MRCPRCQFVVFRDIERCPSCGEDLQVPAPPRTDRIVRDVSAVDGGPLEHYSTVDDVVGPLADYSLRAPESFVPAARQRQSRAARPPSSGRAKLSLGLDSSTRDAGGSPVDGFAPERSVARHLQRRIAAGLLDLFLLCSINVTIVYFTTRLVGLPVASVVQLPLAPLLAFLAVFNVGYAVTLTVVGGQTIGKMTAGLRVEEADGSRVTPTHALIRTAAYAVSVLPFGVGFASMFLKSRRALHDLLADTRVVRLS